MADTIKGLEASIEDAGSTGKPSWDKSAFGIKYLLLKISKLLRSRGLLYAADITSLSLLRGADADLVIVPNVGVYKYNYSNEGLTVNDVQAAQGGVWKKIFSALVFTDYKTEFNTIDVSVDSIINHKLGTLFPDVRVFQELPSGLARITDYDVITVDTDTCKIVWDSGVSQTHKIHVFVKK